MYVYTRRPTCVPTRCVAIAQLAMDNPSNQDRLNDVGACEAVTQAMGSMDAQLEASHAVRRLSINHPANQRRLSHAVTVRRLSRATRDPAPMTVVEEERV
jgi:hypothetical protein